MAVSLVDDEYTVQELLPRKQSSRNIGELGKDEFLKLLITQLKYQDPLQPMDDKEFIAQMAQFTSLEQMKNLNTSIDNMKAYNLIGKMVYAQYTDEHTGQLKTAEGEVEGVKVISGNVHLTVDGQDVPVDKVREVTNLSDIHAQMARLGTLEQIKYLNTSIEVMKAYSLMGKTVTAELMNEELDGADTITGTVEGVSIIDGRVYLRIAGRSIPVENVSEVTISGNGQGEGAEGTGGADGASESPGEDI